jgi:heme exporter protein D
MAFETFADFLQMGRHGVYVWSAYAFSIFVLIGLGWESVVARKSQMKQLNKRLYRESLQ